MGRANALEHLDVRDNALKTVGKIMLLPVTGSFRVVRAFVEFLLREDAADAEYIEDDNDSDGDEK